MDYSTILGIIMMCAVKICSSHPVSNNSSTTKIHLKDYPYQCVIRIEAQKFLLCEGAVIDEKWVLTAAGCVDKYKSNPELLDVVAGIISTKNVESEPYAQMRKVSHINVSPSWVHSKKKAGDLALIELLKPFTFNKFVNKAIFGKNAAINETARLIGYGESQNLTIIEMKIISKEECNLKTHDTSELFCARKDNSRNAFNDESYAGAPLVSFTNSSSSRDVVGLVSAKSSYFTSIAHHKTWIESVAKIKSSNSATTETSHATEESSWPSDDGSASNKTNSPTNGTITTSTTPLDDDSEDEIEESEEETTETTVVTSTTDSGEDSSMNEDESEETTTSNSTTEETDETEETEESVEENTTTEEYSTESTEDYFDESEETTTTESEEESTEASESDESSTTEPHSTTTKTSATPTSTSHHHPTATPTSTSHHHPTTTPTSTSHRHSTATPTSTSQPTATTSTSASTTTTEAPSTPSTTEDYDYYDWMSHNRGQNANNNNNNNNNNKISPPDTGSDTVISNSAQPSNPSLISATISKANNLINSLKKLKFFFTA